MKFCMMSCMCGGLPRREIIQIAQDCGMSAVDWVGRQPMSAHELRKLCSDAGLPIAAYTPLERDLMHCGKNAMEELKQSIEYAVDLGVHVIMIPPFDVPDASTLEDARKRWIEFYANAFPLAKAAGLQMTVESTGMLRSPLTTGEEIKAVLDAVPGMKVTFDQGNTATAGDEFAAYRMLKDDVVQFHIKDWLIADIKQSEKYDLKRNGKYYADTMIGTGDLDVKGFWEQVDDRGKQLYVNLETTDYTNKLSFSEAMKKVCGQLRNW